MLSIIAFLFCVAPVILIHEMGHLFFAKLSGIKVYEFTLGFGPRLVTVMRNEDGKRKLKFFNRSDEKILGKYNTAYSLKLLPLGGAVYLKSGGTDGEDLSLTNDLHFASYTKKMFVILGGVIFNLISVSALLVHLNMTGLPSDMDQYGFVAEEVSASNVLIHFGDEVDDSTGFVAGSELLSIDGIEFKNGEDVNKYLKNTNKVEYLLHSKRFSGEIIEAISRVHILQIEFRDVKYSKYGFLSSVALSFYQAGDLLVSSFFDNGNYLFNMFFDVETDSKVMSAFDSVPGTSILNFLVKLFVPLTLLIAALNLIPIPILDGGKAVIYTIERITRRTLSGKAFTVFTAITSVGFLFLLAYSWIV